MQGRRRDSSEWLTTGEAAALLGASRQHVVDLCDRGTLPCLVIGSHRRVRRAAVERLRFGATTPATLTRDQERSLWLHRAVAGKFALDPERLIADARDRLRRLREAHRDRRPEPWFNKWSEVLEQGPTAVLDVLTSRDPVAVELRQNSPFAGVLTTAERHTALRAFGRALAALPTDRSRTAV